MGISLQLGTIYWEIYSVEREDGELMIYFDLFVFCLFAVWFDSLLGLLFVGRVRVYCAEKSHQSVHINFHTRCTPSISFHFPGLKRFRMLALRILRV